MIVPETLERIADAVGCSELDEATLDILKHRWPDLRFTFCNDDDMPARMSPALKRESFNLYLVGGGDHCLSLTDDPMHAIGVVLACVEEE